MGARLIQVIEVETARGAGKDADDPVRRVLQYWSVDGELLAERDPWSLPGGRWPVERVVAAFSKRDE